MGNYRKRAALLPLPITASAVLQVAPAAPVQTTDAYPQRPILKVE